MPLRKCLRSIAAVEPAQEELHRQRSVARERERLVADLRAELSQATVALQAERERNQALVAEVRVCAASRLFVCAPIPLFACGEGGDPTLPSLKRRKARLNQGGPVLGIPALPRRVAPNTDATVLLPCSRVARAPYVRHAHTRATRAPHQVEHARGAQVEDRKRMQELLALTAIQTFGDSSGGGGASLSGGVGGSVGGGGDGGAAAAAAAAGPLRMAPAATFIMKPASAPGSGAAAHPYPRPPSPVSAPASSSSGGGGRRSSTCGGGGGGGRGQGCGDLLNQAFDEPAPDEAGPLRLALERSRKDLADYKQVRERSGGGGRGGRASGSHHSTCC